jgi:ATP-binding cassette subfamily F protein uup
LLLAKLLAQQSNLLVMDEPTNDLDVETLELLEELLLGYQGTLLLVPHDRAFLENFVSSTLVLEGHGRVGEYVGGYTDWLRQRPADQPAASGSGNPVAKIDTPRVTAERKLSFNDQRTLEQLPGRIEHLEGEIAAQTAAMNQPAFFQQDSNAIVQANKTLAALQSDLDTAYARWAELDG